MKKVLLGLLCFSLLLPVAAYAYSPDLSIPLGSKSPEEIVIGIIQWVLGFLALVAVVLILIGGFMWMTAAGNEDKISKAKKLLVAAVIGLLIILAAWGITIYALSVLENSTI